MILRNKKTGEYGRFMMCHDDDRYPFYIETTGGIRIYYSNFEEMLEAGWEAYAVPKEPLIKDEKIRKAIQTWAEANSIKKVLYLEKPERILCKLEDTDDSDYEIDFVGHIPTLEDGEDYTIAELCGEEEE